MKIIIGESIPAFNRGEEAILRGMVIYLRSVYPKSEIIYCTEYYTDDVRVFGSIIDKYHEEKIAYTVTGKILKHFSKGVRLNFARIISNVLPEKYTKVFFTDYVRDFLSCDMLLIGHDNLYVNKGRILADFLLMIFANANNTKLVSIGSSVGPFEGKSLSTKMAMWLISKFDTIIFRENMSLEYVSAQGVNKNTKVSADLAFLMGKLHNQNNEGIIQQVENKKNDGYHVIGIALSRALCAKFFSGKLSFVERENQLVEFIENVMLKIHGKRKCFFVFISHVTGIVTGDYQDDRVIHNKLISHIGNKLDYIHLGDSLNAPEIKAIIESLDVLVASRTHTMIAAVSVGTTVVPLTYKNNFKTRGIIGDMCDLSTMIVFLDVVDSSLEEVTNDLIGKLIFSLNNKLLRKNSLLKVTNNIKSKLLEMVV